MRNKIRSIVSAILIIGGLIVVLVGYFTSRDNVTIIGSVIAVLGIVAYALLKSLTRALCKYCSNRLEAANYEYFIKRVEDNKVLVDIKVTCPKCNKVNDFTKEFKMPASINKEEYIEEYCKNKFGN